MDSEVLKFINSFRGKSKDIEDIFLHGYCYYFAYMLKMRFKSRGAEIWYLPVLNHFVCKIRANYYDISGEYILDDDEDVYNWEEYKKIEPYEAKSIINDCILKK